MRSRSRLLAALGALLTASGVFAATAVAMPTLQTDLDDYPPGQTVVITGSGWMPGETVMMVVTEEPTTHAPDTLYSVADENGDFRNTAFAPEEHDIGVAFTVLGFGQTSGGMALTYFTDTSNQITQIAFNATNQPSSFTVGCPNGTSTPLRIQSLNVGGTGENVTGTNNGITISVVSNSSTGRFDTNAAGTYSLTSLSLQITGGNQNTPDFFYRDTTAGSVTLTATVTAKTAAISSLSLGSTATVTKTVAKSNTSMTLATDGSPSQCGSPVTFTATATKVSCTNGTGTPAGLVEFKDGATTIGTSALNGSGVATLTTSALTRGSHSLTAVYVGSANYNTSTSSTVSQTVNDTQAPVVTLNGVSPMTVECHASFVDPGATASDECDGSLAVVVTGSVNANVTGVYTLTYTATDGAGNSASRTRTVNVVDTTPPVVTLSGASPMTVECHSAFVDPGATAVDACNGSLSVVATGAVDANTPGTYTRTYKATDAAGISSSVSRTVNVVDTTPPTVTLLGSDPMTVECHTSFVDPGATASDACNGTLSVVTTGSVDANTPGSYTLAYKATDAAGNTDSKTRTVNVVDTSPPTVTLLGSDPMTVECHTSFVDPGATASDACDGTLSVVTTGSVDANTPGSYTLTYKATDAAGNTDSKTRTVNVVDTTPPTVTLLGSDPMTVECHTPFVDPGATASDACDGTLSVVTTGSVDANTPGSYTLTYKATDAAGNTDSKTRTVNVVDTTPPTVTLLGSDPMTVECHTSFVDPGATASDACNGTLSVVTTGSVDANTPGSYTLAYKATDAAGNTDSKTRTVNVVDTSPPTVTLLGSDPMTVECHTPFVDPGATASDACDGTLSVVTTGSVDANTPGSYTLTYKATDAAGNTDSKTRTVNVVDTTPPTVTLLGSDPMTVECHTPFVDPGATASDACDGTLSVVTTGSVDANTPGSYTLTYKATDAAGNTDSKTRTVNVVDTTPPTVTLLGSDPMTVECHTPFVDPGATASDACDGTLSVVTTGSVDANTPGSYTLTYKTTDAAGNSSVKTRTVDVVDTTPPSLALTGANPMMVECHAPFVDPGAVASDACDGTFAADANGLVNANVPGSYTLTYTAIDAAGNSSTTTRTVNVVDTTPPVVTLNGANPMTVECHASFVDPGATANDACAGSPSVSVSGVVDPNTPGTYTLTYSTSDGYNPGSATRTVNVVDTTRPVPTALALPTVTGQCSASISSAPTATDACSGLITGTTSDPLSHSSQGTFTVVWSFTDAQHNVTTQNQTVIVDDTVSPTISCPSNVVVNAGTGVSAAIVTYADPTASDNCDGVSIVSTPASGSMFPVGVTTVSVTATDVGDNVASCSFTVTVKSAPTVSVAPISVQYSDVAVLSATVSTALVAGQPFTGSVQFYVSGSPVGAPVAIPTGGGVVTLPYTVLQGPGNYPVTASFTSGNAGVYLNGSGGPATLSVTREDARVAYSGACLASTASASSGSAVVTLSATVRDITAIPSDPSTDANPGDIRNATLTFVDVDAGTPIATVPIGLVTAGDAKTGTATYNWSVNIGSANAVSYTIGMVVNGRYIGGSSDDDAVVTVAKPSGDAVTGGGYLVLTSSAGLKAGAPGSRHNFGFNLKFNKSGNSIQGHINAIVRNGGRVYQIKGTSMTSLVTQPITGAATFNGKVNIQDITDPLNTLGVDGNGTLQVKLTDKGEPGSSDQIAITVWNKSGGLWFSSNWNGAQTVEQVMTGGNLSVRGGVNTTLAMAGSTSTDGIDASLPREFEMAQNVPNPFRDQTRFQFALPERSAVKLAIYDLLGREVVSLAQGELEAGRYEHVWKGTDQGGHPVGPGVYFARMDAVSLSGSARRVMSKRVLLVP